MEIKKIAETKISSLNPLLKKDSRGSIPVQNISVPVQNYTFENIRANYLPFNSVSQLAFKGNASKIQNAYIMTGEKEDVPLLATKEHGSYIVDFDSQTEIIYGNDAKKFLNKTEEFKYDTQIIIPRNAKGVLETSDNKTIPLDENSACLINAGAKAKIHIKKGYPMVLMSKKDYDWYERYGIDSKTPNIKDKYQELVFYNSHLYNGEFTPNSLLSDKFTEVDYLKTLGINKWEVKNGLIEELYSQKDKLNEEDKAEIEFVKTLKDKLLKENIVLPENGGYLRLKRFYNSDYMEKILDKKGFSEEEKELFMPLYRRVVQTKKDTIVSLRNNADSFSPEIIKKMKEKGFFFNSKKENGYVYWKEIYGSEKVLENALENAGFSAKEQKEIIAVWEKENKSGFDLTGLKFINKDLAVYNLNDKLNNWTHEKTNWVSNSTVMKSDDGTSPFLGVSLVQYENGDKPIRMSDIRKEEQLHSHPNLGERRQTEIYVITTGAAALNVVKGGKSRVQILKEGDLAVVGPGVLHCVNSISGEYEHIVAQVPSAFQYGFAFKEIKEPPEDYDAKALEQEAQRELIDYKNQTSVK